MSKFDFFDEGVRKVFENFELPAEENAWTNFEAYLTGGAKTFSFLKSLILPGILTTGLLTTLHFASENHLNHNELSEHFNHQNHISEKILDQQTDLNQNQTHIDRLNDQYSSSELTESTTMNNFDSDLSIDQSGHAAAETSIPNNAGNNQLINKENISSNTTSNRVSNTSRNSASSSTVAGVEKNETQNSNTIKFVGRAFRLDAPAKFTPNNDGINDTFMPPALGKTANFQLFVYNSDGDLVFMSDNVEQAWDGKLMNSDDDAPEGHYDWRVELSVDQDLHQHAGKVQLFR